MDPILQIVEITTDYIKLDSLLKLAGLAATGGQAKEIVAQGSARLVGTDGGEEVVTQRGKKLRPGDRVRVDHYTIEVAARAVP